MSTEQRCGQKGKGGRRSDDRHNDEFILMMMDGAFFLPVLRISCPRIMRGEGFNAF